MSTTVWTSYDQVGLAEDVSDVISNISPTKTPFISSLSNEKISARIHEWQEDALATVSTTNAKAEGFTATEATLTATTMRTNYTQILEKTIKVSATADAVKTYGRAKETAYQLAKAGEEIKRDLEASMVGLDQDKVTGDSTTARSMASALFMIAAANAVVADSDTSTTAEVAGPLTEADILTLHRTLYVGGADPTTLMIKPADATIVAGFAAASGTRQRDFGTGQKVVNAVDVYVSPWGSLKVVMNRFILTTFALLYDPENWRKLTLRPWTRTMLAKTGDNEMHMIVGEFSLKHVNFAASGTIENLT